MRSFDKLNKLRLKVLKKHKQENFVVKPSVNCSVLLSSIALKTDYFTKDKTEYTVIFIIKSGYLGYSPFHFPSPHIAEDFTEAVNDSQELVLATADVFNWSLPTDGNS